MRKVGFALGVLLLSSVSGLAHAEVRLDTSTDRVEPVVIAIPDFYRAGGLEKTLAADVASVVRADLQHSGLFTPLITLNPDDVDEEDTPPLNTAPPLDEWRQRAAQVVVQGASETLPDGRLRLSMRVWEVASHSQMIGFAYVTPADNWRRIAHIMADEIYHKITGEGGYFDTRLVYVAETMFGTRKVKQLAIMDQDGANHRYLSDGALSVSSPRFSPRSQEISYVGQSSNALRDSPRVYVLNTDNGHQELLGEFSGLITAPRFSPDGNKVVLYMMQEGVNYLTELDLSTRRPHRLATRPSTDSAPCFAPDGQQVVFVSTRSGAENLYVMNTDGGRVHRVSFGEGRYASPVWSPRGDLIAFIKNKGGQAYVGVIKADGTGERLLAAGQEVDSPTWSPNGRVLLFHRADRKGGEPGLYSIDLTGFNERRVPTPTAASDPAWSPLLH